MPGAPLLTEAPSYQGVQSQGIRPAASAEAPSSTAFIVWLVLIGVVAPAVVLGGLKFFGFQFVFHSR